MSSNHLRSSVPRLKVWHVLLALVIAANMALLGWSISAQASVSLVPGAKAAPDRAWNVQHRHHLARLENAQDQRQAWHAAAVRRARQREAQRASVLLAEWTRVATCEESGWIGYAGYAFPDSLGIMRSAWFAFGGGSDLSPFSQIAVAQRLLAANGLAGWVPDQGYCAAW